MEPLKISEIAADMLVSYSWPGNVRELENFMERMCILCDEDEIVPEDLPEKIWKDVGREPQKKLPKWSSLRDSTGRLWRI